MRLRPIALALAVFVAVLGVFVWRGLREQPLAVERGEPALQSRPAPASPNPIAAPADPAIAAQRVEAVSEPASAPAPAAVDTAPATALLNVFVVELETGGPVAGTGLTVQPTGNEEEWQSKQADGSEGGPHDWLISDGDGHAAFTLPAGTAFTVYAGGRDSPHGRGELEVPALAAGERREVTVRVPTHEDLRFFGRLVADADGAPVAKARIAALDSDGDTPDFLDALVPAARALESDADGRFEVSGHSWRRPLVRIQADGFAPAAAAVVPGHETPESAFVVRLFRPASLRVHAIDGAKRDVAGVTVRASVSGWSLAQGELWFDAARAKPIERSAKSGADGRATLADLPPKVAVEIAVLRDGKLVRRLTDALTLDPGEQRELELVVGERARLTGVVLDQNEQPVADQALWLVKPENYHINYFFPHTSPQKRERSDAAGRFAFDDIAEGDWLVGPPPTARGKEPPDDALAPYATQVTVAPGSGGADIVLHVWRGLFVRGRVVLTTGEPAPEAGVSASSKDGRSSLYKQARDDGTFAVGPLIDGVYTLTAGGVGMSNFARSAEVTAPAGATDVVLVVAPGASILGTLLDDAAQEPPEAEILLASLDPSPQGFALMQSSVHAGKFEMNGLAAGVYDLFATLRGGRIARGRVTLAEGERREVTLRAEPAAKLVVENAAKDAQAFFWYEVRCDGALIVSSGLGAGDVGRCAVPPGMIAVAFLDPERKPLETQTLTLAAGEEKTVRHPPGPK